MDLSARGSVGGDRFGGEETFEGDLRPGFHAVEAFAELIDGGELRGHQVRLVDGELRRVGFEQIDQTQMHLANRSGVI